MSDTRPPLDVEPFTDKQIARWRREAANREVPPDTVWHDHEVISLVARFLVTLDAAYQPTGPDDLAELPWEERLREALRFVFDREPTDEEFARHAARKSWRDAAEREASGVTLRVRSSEVSPVGLSPELRCPRCGGGYFRCEDPWHEQGVRSSEVDGLREALDEWAAAHEAYHNKQRPDEDVSADADRLDRAEDRLRAALTGDTGPKVEPEP